MAKHMDLTGEITRGTLSVQQAASRIASERDGDTSDFLIPCGACGSLHQFAESHSACLWLAFQGSRLAGGFQMKEGPQEGAFPHQHFACSESCLQAQVLDCLQNHYLPAARQRHQEAQNQQKQQQAQRQEGKSA